VAAAVAALPDIDLLARTLHRSATHSLFSGVVVFIIAAAVTRWVIPAAAPFSIAAICCTAWLSHGLLDWMGTDTNPPRGIQWLWPFSERWFISGWDLFPPTERRDPWSWPTMVKNAKAAAFEAASMGAVAAVAWWVSGRRRVGR
jgi:hypothetical protein